MHSLLLPDDDDDDDDDVAASKEHWSLFGTLILTISWKTASERMKYGKDFAVPGCWDVNHGFY